MVQQPANELQFVLKAVSYLRTHWWLFALESLVVFGIALHNFYSTQPTFEAHASLLIDSYRRNIYQSVLLGPQQTNSQSVNLSSRRQNMANLISSHDVFERLRTQLTDIYNTNGRPVHLRPFFPSGVALPAEAFRKFAWLGWDRNSDVYSINCKGNTPDFARDVCLAYLNTIQAYYPQIGQRDTLLKHDFIRQEIKSLNQQIYEREDALMDFQRKNDDMIRFLTLNLADRGLHKYEEEQYSIKEKMTINRATKNFVLSMESEQGTKVSSLELSTKLLGAKLSDLEFQLQLTQESSDSDRNQRLQILRDRIRRVQGQLNQIDEDALHGSLQELIPQAERRKKLAELEMEYRSDQIRLENISRELEAIHDKTRRYQIKALEYDHMTQELDHRRKLLSQLYQKEQELELDIASGNAEIYRLEEPVRDSLPVEPKLSKFLYAALSMNLALLVATLALLLALMPRLDSEAEVNRLNLPVLGKIPAMGSIALTGVEEGSFGYEYAKIMNYRILRETKDIPCPIVIISSPNAREGKSTVSQILCIASRGPGRKSLLIDGDLLTFNHNRLFGVHEDATPGLKSILEGNAPADFQSLTVKTMHDGVSFLPRGDRIEPSVTPNFLDPVKAMLAKARTQYDMIFIDTPPMFQSNLAHQWCNVADLVVLVARMFYTRPRDIMEAIQTTKLFTKAPIGTALNCVSMGSLQRRASHYYYFSRRKPKPPKLAA